MAHTPPPLHTALHRSRQIDAYASRSAALVRTLESKRETRAVFCKARDGFAQAGLGISESDDEHAGAPTQAEPPLTLAAGVSAGAAYFVKFSTHPEAQRGRERRREKRRRGQRFLANGNLAACNITFAVRKRRTREQNR